MSKKQRKRWTAELCPKQWRAHVRLGNKGRRILAFWLECPSLELTVESLDALIDDLIRQRSFLKGGGGDARALRDRLTAEIGPGMSR